MLTELDYETIEEEITNYLGTCVALRKKFGMGDAEANPKASKIVEDFRKDVDAFRSHLPII